MKNKTRAQVKHTQKKKADLFEKKNVVNTTLYSF